MLFVVSAVLVEIHAGVAVLASRIQLSWRLRVTVVVISRCHRHLFQLEQLVRQLSVMSSTSVFQKRRTTDGLTRVG